MKRAIRWMARNHVAANILMFVLIVAALPYAVLRGRAALA